MWDYSTAALDHQLSPRCVGVPAGATVVGEAADGIGDTRYRLGLVLDADGGIETAGFTFRGAAHSVASTSLLCTLIRCRNIEFAAKVTEEELSRAMGGLPEDRMRHPVLGLEALRDAFRRWSDSRPGGTSRLVCTCNLVDESRIREAMDGGASTVQEIGERTKAGTGCGTCRPRIAELLVEWRAAEISRGARLRLAATLSAADQVRMELIEEVLDAEVRPGLALDGGGLEVVGLQGKRLEVAFRGACTSCGNSLSTMRFLVIDRLHSLVDPGLEVVESNQTRDPAVSNK